MAHLLGAEAVHLEYPTKVVFDAVTLGIGDGDRIGIVGRNGDGKSTLLGLLTGRITPDEGRITRRRDLRVGVLEQTDSFTDDDTVGSAIVGDRVEHEWAGDARVRDVVNGLVADLAWDASVTSLSGGQRRRVALAAVLAHEHDLVVLDEPTNHLDIEGVAWLAAHLDQRWPSGTGGLLVVTHDRWLLDAVSTTTWEVHDRVVEPFEGGYAAYVLQRVERDRVASVAETQRQNLARKELAWLRRGPPARTAKPKFRIEAANRLIASEPPARDTVALHQLAMSRLGKQVIDIEGASVAYGDNVILRDVTWSLGPGDRVGILGVNGAGKSTLLKLLTGDVPPSSGVVRRGKTINVATLSQQGLELDPVRHLRVREILEKRKTTYSVAGKPVTATQLLERLGFSSAHLSSTVDELSGGQQRRFQLLLVLLDEPNVLIMDEPTNDLDTDMLAAMEDLLDSWPGTLIVVSHDRYLLERITDQQYAVVAGHLRHMPGGVDQYLASQGGRQRRSTSEAFDSRGKAPRDPQALSNIELRSLQKELASIDRKLAKIPSQITQIETRIAAHDQADYVGLGELAETLNALRHKRADLEDRWLELSELLD